MTYEYRIVQQRPRWVMDCPYDEWFRPISQDFDDGAEARQHLYQLRTQYPDAVLKLQRRPKIQEWKDLRV